MSSAISGEIWIGLMTSPSSCASRSSRMYVLSHVLWKAFAAMRPSKSIRSSF
jgi:hypothetical protein